MYKKINITMKLNVLIPCHSFIHTSVFLGWLDITLHSPQISRIIMGRDLVLWDSGLTWELCVWWISIFFHMMEEKTWADRCFILISNTCVVGIMHSIQASLKLCETWQVDLFNFENHNLRRFKNYCSLRGRDASIREEFWAIKGPKLICSQLKFNLILSSTVYLAKKGAAINLVFAYETTWFILTEHVYQLFFMYFL